MGRPTFYRDAQVTHLHRMFRAASVVAACVINLISTRIYGSKGGYSESRPLTEVGFSHGFYRLESSIYDKFLNSILCDRLLCKYRSFCNVRGLEVVEIPWISRACNFIRDA